MSLVIRVNEILSSTYEKGEKMEYVSYKKAENVTFARYHAEGYKIHSVTRVLFSVYSFCYLFNGELITAGFLSRR